MSERLDGSWAVAQLRTDHPVRGAVGRPSQRSGCRAERRLSALNRGEGWLPLVTALPLCKHGRGGMGCDHWRREVAHSDQSIVSASAVIGRGCRHELGVAALPREKQSF